MERPKLISKFDRNTRIIYLICLLLFAGLAIGCISNYDVKNIKTASYLIGAVGFLVFLFFAILEIYNSPKIIIYSDKVEFIRIFKVKTDVLQVSDIQSWIKREKKSKYGNYEILHLVLCDLRKIKIRSYNYSNFHQLEQKLIHKKPKNIELGTYLETKENRRYAASFIILGLVFIFITTKTYENKPLTNDDIAIVKGHLLQPIKIERGRKSNSLVIKLEEFSEFSFRVSGMELSEIYYDDLIKDFKEGQEVQLAIEKTDYEKKISKTNSLTYWDLIFHYDKIHILEIEANNYKYLSLEDYNRVHNSNKKWILGFFGLLGLFSTTGGIMMFRKTK